MSIQYDLYDTPDIQQTGDAQPLHPRVVFKGTVDQEEFLDRVHKFTGISRSLLAGACDICRELHHGWRNVHGCLYVPHGRKAIC